MVIVSICETYGWTYSEYLEQPQFFLDLIKEKMKIDAQVAKNEANKNKTWPKQK